MRKLNHPLVAYIVISAISLIVAILLFMVGGSVADIAETSVALGITIEASGAIAGFIIVFLYSKRAVIDFQNNAQNVDDRLKIKMFLTTNTGPFSKQEDCYSCQCIMIDQQNGDRKEIKLNPFWEAGHLTVIVPDIVSEDFISFRVSSRGQQYWETDFFSPRNQTIKLEPKG